MYDDLEYAQGEKAAALVPKLEAVTTVPRLQIEKFMKLRTARSVERLTAILSELGNATPAADVRSQSSSCRSHSRRYDGPATHRPENRSATADNEEYWGNRLYLHQKNTTHSWKSTYAQFLGESAAQAAEEVPSCSSSSQIQRTTIGSGAFDKVWRPDQKEKLNQWKVNTKDDNIRFLADVCRGIFSQHERDCGHRTTHRNMFQQHSTFAKRVEKDRNLSKIPIGAIYETDSWEMEATMKRDKEQRQGLQRIRGKQDMMLRHRSNPLRPIKLSFNHKSKLTDKYKESEQVSSVLSYLPSKVDKSEYRLRFVGHST